MSRPIIGITVSNREPAAGSSASTHYESAVAYSRAVTLAGGLPMLLPQEPALAREYAEVCDGVLLTGGPDPRMEQFGEATHALAKLVDERRQVFELALLDALQARREMPVLGVCLGMQFMSLHAGGKMHQHLPDVLGEAAMAHQKDNRHGVRVVVDDGVLSVGSAKPQAAGADVTTGNDTVVSWHHQAVSDSGRLRLVATAPDGVIEAVDDPARPFYLGVQWHPERGGEGAFNSGLLARFVAACRRGTTE